MPQRNVHVGRRDQAWAVVSEKTSRATRLLPNQEKAIRVARTIAQNRKVELVIHRRDNTIRDKDSYGSDPMPPKDKRH